MISDTAAQVPGSLDALTGYSKISAIALTDAGAPSLSITYSQYTDDSTVLGKLSGSYSLVVSAAPVSAAAALQADSHVTTFAISDTAAHVLADLDGLDGVTKVSTIAFTDADAPSLSITYTQYTADATALSKIIGSYTLVVSAVPVSASASLQADNHVTAFALLDSSHNVVASLGTLIEDSKLSSITLSDGQPLVISETQNEIFHKKLDTLAPEAILLINNGGAPNLITLVDRT